MADRTVYVGLLAKLELSLRESSLLMASLMGSYDKLVISVGVISAGVTKVNMKVIQFI